MCEIWGRARAVVEVNESYQTDWLAMDVRVVLETVMNEKQAQAMNFLSSLEDVYAFLWLPLTPSIYASLLLDVMK